MTTLLTPEEDLFSRVKEVPADKKVYQQVNRRLNRLSQIRTLIRKPKSLVPINSKDYVYELRYQWQVEYPGVPFRITGGEPRGFMHEECRKAREWLLGIVRMQEKVHGRPIRILRAGIDREEGRGVGLGESDGSGDLVRLYMALTAADEDDPDDDEWDAEGHLDTAFMIVLHHDYATKYADVLEKLRRETGRLLKRSLSPNQRILNRMVEKTQSSKVDAFACSIPLATIKIMSVEDQACMICQNAYLDLKTFVTEDLIADYPVRIKYCGHILGKSCLETWMATPPINAAKYPFHTCPVCRVEIEGCETPDVPIDLVRHVGKDDAINVVMKASDEELEEEECWEGICRCISEEFVLEELVRELEGLRLAGKLGVDKLAQCDEVLMRSLKQVEEEKKMWGFSGELKDTTWKRIRKEWIECGTMM